MINNEGIGKEEVALKQAAGLGTGWRTSRAGVEENDPVLNTHINQLLGLDGETAEAPSELLVEGLDRVFESTSKKPWQYRLAIAEAEIEKLRHEKVVLEEKVMKLELGKLRTEVRSERRKKKIAQLEERCRQLKESKRYSRTSVVETSNGPSVLLEEAKDLRIEKYSIVHGRPTFSIRVTFPSIGRDKLEAANFEKEVEEFLKDTECTASSDHDWTKLLREWKSLSLMPEKYISSPHRSKGKNSLLADANFSSSIKDRDGDLKPSTVAKVTNSFKNEIGTTL